MGFRRLKSCPNVGQMACFICTSGDPIPNFIFVWMTKLFSGWFVFSLNTLNTLISSIGGLVLFCFFFLLILPKETCQNYYKRRYRFNWLFVGRATEVKRRLWKDRLTPKSTDEFDFFSMAEKKCLPAERFKVVRWLKHRVRNRFLARIALHMHTHTHMHIHRMSTKPVCTLKL